MIVDNFISCRLWRYSGNPDSNVHSSSFQFPALGDFFINDLTGSIFRCRDETAENQVWDLVVDQPEVQSMISSAIAAIPQADWTQSNVSLSDYIKHKPTLSTVATSGSYNDLSNKPSIPAAQIQSNWTQANSGSVDFIKNKPAAPASMSQSSATRSLNSSFQVSTTRWSTVNYCVDISTTVSLSGAQVGRVILEIASDSGFTTNVQTLGSFGNGNSGTLVIGLVLTQLCTACLGGNVPPNYYVRLRTVNTTGTPTYTYVCGQEVLI